MRNTKPDWPTELIIDKGHLPADQARELWSLAFPDDTSAFKDWFFAAQFSHLWCWSAREKDKLLAVVYAMPYTLVCRGKTIPAPLILGVATHPDARRRGIMRKLLENVHHDLARTCPAACLHPFDFGFYHKLGYSVVSEQLSVRLPAAAFSTYEPCGFVDTEPDFARLALINRRHTQHMGFFALRDASLLARRFADLQTGGGFCIVNNNAYAFVDPANTPNNPSNPNTLNNSSAKILRLSEFSYTNHLAGCSLLASLSQSFAASQVEFALAGDDARQWPFPQESSCEPKSSCTLTRNPFLMLRGLDIPALATGMYAPSLSHASRPLHRVLHIHDDTTRWQVTVAAGIVTLSPTETPWDVSLTRDQLMRWICGYSDAEALAAEGVAQADCLSFLPKLSAFFFDMY
ncbi:MAG: GNAT family N-acetyltransferase [Peptococcaceae bacterium]|nr:GNAT family N-acetyltransferase [Peptococcaceae bacterium]